MKEKADYQDCIRSCKLCAFVCESVFKMIVLNSRYLNTGVEIMKLVCSDCEKECKKRIIFVGNQDKKSVGLIYKNGYNS